MNSNKPDKVRVVFDCAAKYDGVSLNSQFLQGPDLINNLVGVLIRVREELIAMMADVEGMFHQVRVSPKDCDALRFLWWPGNDLNKDPEDYQMLVHLFGATSSASGANREFKKRRRRRRRQRRLKNELIFYPRISRYSKVIQFVSHC